MKFSFYSFIFFDIDNRVLKKKFICQKFKFKFQISKNLSLDELKNRLPLRVQSTARPNNAPGWSAGCATPRRVARERPPVERRTCLNAKSRITKHVIIFFVYYFREKGKQRQVPWWRRNSIFIWRDMDKSFYFVIFSS